MSHLQKKIHRIQRREGPRLGFGPSVREQPRAMLLGVLATDTASLQAAAAGGADVVILQTTDAASAVAAIKKAEAKDVALGVWLPALDEASATALREGGCDFALGTLETTASAAVDTEAMGQVIVASEDLDDTTLRALAPLALDGLFFAPAGGPMTLAQQLGLVRLASFTGTPLLVTVAASASVSELRVLRDSGVGVVVVPGTTPRGELEALGQSLRDVPAPRRSRRDGQDMAIVPATAAASGRHEHDDDGDE